MQYLVTKIVASILFLSYGMIANTMNNNEPYPIFRSASGTKLRTISCPLRSNSEKTHIIHNQIGSSLAPQLMSPRFRKQSPSIESKIEVRSNSNQTYVEKLPQNIATIFSFDGGGIRGLISAAICELIENQMKDIWKRVNLFAGTSIGGGLATALATQDENINASYLKKIFLEDGSKVFKRTWKNWLTYGLSGSKYYSDGRREIFSNLLGDKKLSDLQKDLLITTYNLDNHSPLFISTYRAKSGDYDYNLSDLVMATSAAPTYFDPFELYAINNGKSKEAPLLVADGGLIANDPSLCALVEAGKIYPNADAFTLVSIGTGYSTNLSPIRYSNLFEFASYVPDIMVTTPCHISKYIDYLSGYLYKKPVYFCRLDVEIKEPSHMAMDDTSKENLEYLSNIVNSDEDLKRLISSLCNFISRYDVADQKNLNKCTMGRGNNFYLFDNWSTLKFVESKN